MDVTIINEAGYFPAMLGLSLSYNQDVGKMPAVADRLKDKYAGHNKFLESIYLWVDVNAPRYWHQQADTYRLTTKQSESTEHTLTRYQITSNSFEDYIDPEFINRLEEMRINKDLRKLKAHLPESFLQRRIWVMNYMVLKNIIKQRSTHKMPQWQYFIEEIKKQVEHPELL